MITLESIINESICIKVVCENKTKSVWSTKYSIMPNYEHEIDNDYNYCADHEFLIIKLTSTQ